MRRNAMQILLARAGAPVFIFSACAVLASPGAAGTGHAVEGEEEAGLPAAPSALPIEPEMASLPGARPFISYGCYACHGYYSHGSLEGPTLSTDKMPMEAFRQIVRQPSGVMPAYPAEHLSEEALAQIYIYLAAVPADPAAGDIPLLRAAEGFGLEGMSAAR